MLISELRRIVGMSQQKFACYFGIPVGTLRNWEQGIAKPPEYVSNMIFQSIRRDRMINVETMKFVKILDELARKSKNGIEDFSDATKDTLHTKVFYDTNSNFKIVADACVVDMKECYHHDAISFYEDSQYVINALFDEGSQKPYLVVKLTGSEEQIVIEDGEWYFV